MYGTVMIGRLAAPREKVDAVSKEWITARSPQVPGFLGETVLWADDGLTVAVCVRFTDKASYLALADDPEQDRWWREQMAPLFDGEVQWVDGSWDELA